MMAVMMSVRRRLRRVDVDETNDISDSALTDSASHFGETPGPSMYVRNIIWRQRRDGRPLA